MPRHVAIGLEGELGAVSVPLLWRHSKCFLNVLVEIGCKYRRTCNPQVSPQSAPARKGRVLVSESRSWSRALGASRWEHHSPPACPGSVTRRPREGGHCSDCGRLYLRGTHGNGVSQAPGLLPGLFLSGWCSRGPPGFCVRPVCGQHDRTYSGFFYVVTAWNLILWLCRDICCYLHCQGKVGMARQGCGCSEHPGTCFSDRTCFFCWTPAEELVHQMVDTCWVFVNTDHSPGGCTHSDSYQQDTETPGALLFCPNFLCLGGCVSFCRQYIGPSLLFNLCFSDNKGSGPLSHDHRVTDSLPCEGSFQGFNLVFKLKTCRLSCLCFSFWFSGVVNISVDFVYHPRNVLKLSCERLGSRFIFGFICTQFTLTISWNTIFGSTILQSFINK